MNNYHFKLKVRTKQNDTGERDVLGFGTSEEEARKDAQKKCLLLPNVAEVLGVISSRKE